MSSIAFTRGGLGLYRADVTPAAIAAAERRMAAQYVRPVKNPSSLWRGYLGEAGFARFLSDRRIPFVWNGGVDSLPDFELDGGMTIGVHAIGWKRPPDLSRWEVDLWEGKKSRGQEAWQVFACVVEEPSELVLFGMISTARFFRSARFVPAGERINRFSTMRTESDSWRLLVSRLSDVDDVLDAHLGPVAPEPDL